eukprot:TRINITY_DN895_c0_g1_i5.p1 TRINITY_DN895_c0_g1~~TRINITY_DN895_c0_g1_i5.p1  ORF type:complete len:211 (-),score=24.72 TRINITY_DN895_c0_g1_i5:165-797(-)
MRSTIHYQDRITKISQKLNNIQSGKDNEKAQKLDANEIKLKQLEEQFYEFQDVLDNRLQGLKENLIKIHHLIDGQKQNREMAFEQKMKEIQQIDQKFTYAIDQETIQRKEGENKFIRIINDKSATIRTEVIKENQIRNENLDTLNQCLESDFYKLNEDIKVEQQERNEMDSNLGKKVNEEVNKLNTQISVEKKTREDGEQGIFDLSLIHI